MTILVKDILEVLEGIAPFSLAEAWDNVGLLLGNPDQEVSGLLVAVDPTIELLDEALTMGANTIVTHHPLIFHPLLHIHTNHSDGLLLERALGEKINMIACHTNLDRAADGVSDALAKALGLIDLSPLVPADMAENQGLGRVGYFPESIGSAEFLKIVLQTLNLSSVSIAGNLPEKIVKIALCGGSGSDLALLAQGIGADIFLSAEIKHSTARWAEESGFCIIDGGHYGTERPVVDLLVEKLRSSVQDNKWEVEIFPSKKQKNPFKTLSIKNFNNDKGE